jgi:hypothetical protein
MYKTVNQELSTKLDQYYTNPIYADYFFNKIKKIIDISMYDVLLEPSAGTGSFYKLLDESKRIGLDLDPKLEGIVKTDFFQWSPPIGEKIITVGNPPFGKNSSLAIKFFNHAAEFSDVIAFVLPRTFRKSSVINRLHKNFHLVFDETVPDNSFIFNGQHYNVWCTAQIWVKKAEKRKNVITHKLTQVTKWFSIVDPSASDFAIQRVGGKAGLIREIDYKNYSPSSHYFIKTNDSRVLDIFKTINFDGVKFNTAGNPSISPSELVELFVNAAKEQHIMVSVDDYIDHELFEIQ